MLKKFHLLCVRIAVSTIANQDPELRDTAARAMNHSSLVSQQYQRDNIRGSAAVATHFLKKLEEKRTKK